MINVASIALILVGALFFLAGTLGLLRLPDVFSRLHALTKADNLGLGLVVVGLALQASDVLQAIKLLLVWIVAMLAAATAAQLVAQHAHGDERQGDWE
ncbi:monovalent cation/H(+) antiporter subunit G [Aquibaculum arenosum]|uniref:Monovalent cation/H(+) antiporter subunit G n=1 Tax=Aquibaculum arenosum TaxID=3032591 RepID=A0ABT5YI03_9PROT|nr:monovalent cation/H(+) antiporter subunit G [Fodinicurvata sp. CAU 1616]MDF2094537.1 monovalent cation/H(+) antiporter subunit G [Fodinicurvata sp. CAU 1616]